MMSRRVVPESSRLLLSISMSSPSRMTVLYTT